MLQWPWPWNPDPYFSCSLSPRPGPRSSWDPAKPNQSQSPRSLQRASHCHCRCHQQHPHCCHHNDCHPCCLQSMFEGLVYCPGRNAGLAWGVSRAAYGRSTISSSPESGTRSVRSVAGHSWPSPRIAGLRCSPRSPYMALRSGANATLS